MSSPGAMSSNKSSNRINGFPPVVGCRPRALILGSMPGVASLSAHEYYAMPRNAFWRIMSELFGADIDDSYQQRLDVLTGQRVALWDVLASCIRPGSLDSSIDTRSIAANDFGRLFADNPSISQVFFNGKKAAEMYHRHVHPVLDLDAAAILRTTLPSTSPAHAALSFDAKLAAWSIVRDAARRK